MGYSKLKKFKKALSTSYLQFVFWFYLHGLS